MNRMGEPLLYKYVAVDVNGTIFREISGEADQTYSTDGKRYNADIASENTLKRLDRLTHTQERLNGRYASPEGHKFQL